MTRLYYELFESVRIAFAQIRANKLRSALTALGVIIGIVAVTLMGTAMNGIDRGFASRILVLALHRILEVQHHEVGGERSGLVDRPRVGCRQKQQRPDREQVDAHADFASNNRLTVASCPLKPRGEPC